MSDPTELMKQMAERSRRKLTTPKNLAKGSWLNMTHSEIGARILDEIDELYEALATGSWEKIADEAADVYHFASMGADTERIRRQRGSETD